MTYIIALPCVDLLDKTCIDECPVDCIYEGDRMLYIHPDECVDCGACEPVCPVEAISFEADVPAQWKGFYRINVEFFEGIGSPGGASRGGRIGIGHPAVARPHPPRQSAAIRRRAPRTAGPSRARRAVRSSAAAWSASPVTGS